MDSTVIVTASKQTKKEDLRRVIKNIKNVGGRIAGVIVNKITIDAKKYEQSYYYGSTSATTSRQKNHRPAPVNRPANIQNKVEDMKRRVRPENPQSSRVQQERRQRLNNDEQPKALQNKIKMEKSKEVSNERTADILNQINAYLDKEQPKA